MCSRRRSAGTRAAGTPVPVASAAGFIIIYFLITRACLSKYFRLSVRARVLFPIRKGGGGGGPLVVSQEV